METKCISWREKSMAAEALRNGGVVVFPTETVYGIGALASSHAAVELLREAKGRPENKPITLMCSSAGEAVRYCRIDGRLAATMRAFMPGEVTFLVPAKEDIPFDIDLGTGVVGVRVPDDPEVRSLIEEVGEPLLVSSANRSGQEPAHDYDQARETFGGIVPVIVKGTCKSNVPSTIMDFVHLKRGKPVCVRKGSVDPENITEEYECADLRVSIGSDHGGFAYKQQIIAHLKENGYLVLDLGCPDTKSVDYPEFGMAVGRDVSYGKAYFGVVVCTSGIGISIAANKVPGIRCGLAYDDVVTSKMREHNNANVIAFGQKYMKLDDVLRRLDIFLCTSFSKEAKHRRRVAQISD